MLRVTNLNAEGPGSLREALAAKGPRIVLFEVGGVIDLQTKGITITEPFLTVAGQTAPSPGITLVRGGLILKTHDILLRHLRVRPGDAGHKRGSGWEPEVSLWGAEAYNIVIDHCSFTWGVEDNLSIGGPQFEGEGGAARNVTVSHSLIAEALNDSSHGRGPHSVGTWVGDNSTNIAFIANLFAHNDRANPSFRANTTGVLVNNYIYNPGHSAIQLDWRNSDWRGRPEPKNPRLSVVGNVMHAGPSTEEGAALLWRKGDVYLADNLAFDPAGTPAAITAGLINVLNERPGWPRGLVPMPAAKVADYVLRTCGARPKDRDEVDRRIVSEVRERKGKIINSQEDVGGYPKQAMTRRRLIVPAEDVEEWLGKLAAEVE